MFAKIVFPLSFNNAFTYSIPKEFEDNINVGVRVVASFGRRVLTGFVIDIIANAEKGLKIKPLMDVLDDSPIFDKQSLKFYEWIAEYYISSLGEALKNSVPYGLEVESKKRIVSDSDYCAELLEKENKKSTIKAKLLKILSEKDNYRISQLQKLVKKKSIYQAIKSLEREGALSVIDEIEDSKVRIKRVKFVKLIKSPDEIFPFMNEIEKRSPKQTVILLELIANKKEDIQLSVLLKKTGSSHSSAMSLEKKGYIQIFEKEVNRFYTETYTEDRKEIKLTEAQSGVINEISEKINSEEFCTYLLHGVTGSGKTQVYIELARHALNLGKNVIMLVPEISLTPQITSRFFDQLGDSVAVFHSRMSLGERYDTWRGIKSGKFKIVVGPRSALFSPLKNIGLIVVDEEHDSSYKQWESIPKYHARDSAIVKAKFSSCPVLLGSATPSLESMYNAHIGKYKLLELKERVDNAKLPQIKMINIRTERKQRKIEYVFSKYLLDQINLRIENKKGVIILQNRRGFSTQIYCEDCGEIIMCNNCSVPMVYHINNNLLQCHYCGESKTSPKACPNCGSVKLKYFGAGTQKVEDELAFYFPNAKIERIDSDSISKRGKLSGILNQFRKGEIDILVGTQMVSKGLDFANVTLVGVVSAEATLWMPDFRADERTYQLLTQVSGRAGRSASPGEVVIQSTDPSHFVLQKVFNNDYHGFYAREIKLRQNYRYPPFYRLGLVEFKDEHEKDAKGAAVDFYKFLLKYGKRLEINKPTAAIIARIKSLYRFQLLVRSDKSADAGGKILRTAVMNAYTEFNKLSRYKNIRIIIDIDPVSLM